MPGELHSRCQVTWLRDASGTVTEDRPKKYDPITSKDYCMHRLFAHVSACSCSASVSEHAPECDLCQVESYQYAVRTCRISLVFVNRLTNLSVLCKISYLTLVHGRKIVHFDTAHLASLYTKMNTSLAGLVLGA